MINIKIKRITLENVKSFKDKTEVEFDDEVNIFIGSNRSGKSNLLDSIIVIIRREVIYNWVIQETQHGSPPRKAETIHHQRLFDPPRIHLEKYFGYESNPQRISLYLLVTNEDLKGIQIARDNIEKLREIEPLVFINSGVTNGVRLDGPLPSQDSIIKIDIQDWNIISTIDAVTNTFLTYTRNYELFANLIDKYNQRVTEKERIQVLPPLFQYFPPNRDSTFGSEEVVLSKIKSNEVIKEFSNNTSRSTGKSWDYISYFLSMKMRHLGDSEKAFNEDSEINSLNRILKKLGYSGVVVQCIDERDNRYIIKTKVGEIIQPPYSMSSGEREILNILFSVYAYGMQNGLLIVDEPELHVHITWQRQMFTMLEEVQKVRKLQILLVTHSPNFITQETLDKTYRVYLENNISRIIRFDDSANKMLTKDVYRIINSLGFQFILFVEKVVLVEGQTDRIIFRSIIDSLQKSDKIENKDRIEVIDVGGKENFKKFKTFLEGFGIQPFIITDLDYIFDRPNLAGCLNSDPERALKKIKEKGSKDGEYLLRLLDSIIQLEGHVVQTEKINELNEFVIYLNHRYRTLRFECQDRKESEINILKKERVFVLSKGEIEDYFDIQHKFGLDDALSIAEQITLDLDKANKELIGITNMILLF